MERGTAHAKLTPRAPIWTRAPIWDYPRNFFVTKLTFGGLSVFYGTAVKLELA